MKLFGASRAMPSTQQSLTKLEASAAINFPKPKILLIDLDTTTQETLRKSGFNIRTGTFGQPYKTQKSANYQQLISEPSLPNHAEQDLIIVDLDYKISQQPIGEAYRPAEEYDLWGKCDKGFIDPRVRGATMALQHFDNILHNGGVFVVFANQKTSGKICLAKKGAYSLEGMEDIRLDEWSFLSELINLEVSDVEGDEIKIVNNKNLIGKILQPYLIGSKFTCSIKTTYKNSGEWIEIANNKFKSPVAWVRTKNQGGTIIVLPQIKDKAGFLKELLTEVLPELVPNLFPDIENGKWVHHDAYELAEVIQLHKDRKKIEEKFNLDLATINEQIHVVREKKGWLHDLLTQTGDPLVAAVLTGLSTLGFRNVIDMDAERDKLGKTRREDLQIQDYNPTLVIDIKGIANFPSDEDVMQANKHATLLIREQSRTDIFGLSIVNHQRHLPPLQRNNEMPFREELNHVALENQFGMITTWSLYRLVLNKVEHGWSHEQIKPILYKHGSIDIIPSHYKYLVVPEEPPEPA